MAQPDPSQRYHDGKSAAAAPSFNIQQASPQAAPYASSSPASSARPSQPSSLSATSPYDPASSQRPVTHHGHSYSRSSPNVSIEHKYIPYPGTPDKVSSGSSSRMYDPRTPTGALSHSPLALADIRPRSDLALEDLMSPSAPAAHGSHITQKTGSYFAPWPIYAYDWCKWSVPNGQGAGKMAICSYLEDSHNFIQILDTRPEQQEIYSPGAPTHALAFSKVAEAACSYPVTRILWEPPASAKKTTDLLATSGDHLRLWSLPTTPYLGSQSNSINRSSNANQKTPPPQKLTPLALLSNSKTPEHTAPLTSLDWNKESPKLIITSSIDTTCTIWDIPSLTAKTQLIAHDKEVFDVRFCANSTDTFVSCGADGSVRMFDLRSLEHSTIIYEPSEKSNKGPSPGALSPGTNNQHTLAYSPPLLRLAKSNIIRILDHRQPGHALMELHGHSAALSCIEWSASRRGVLASGADDSLVLHWDLMNPANGAALPSSTMVGADGAGWGVPSQPQQQQQQQQQQQASGANATTTPKMKGPVASWRCDFEVGNISWSPQSDLTNQGGEWVGVTGGRAVWGVKL